MNIRPIRKVLVANRGEIAIRVFRTCQQRGIACVAVCSEGDRHASHAAWADEAVVIGPTPAAQSYLDGARIIEVARQTGVDAIHPGYGFLSERASFVRDCEAAGITFIGPPAHAMDVMGDKVRARRAMIEAKVPVVPGEEDVDSSARAREVADAIGYPVMLKASAGGGGKGMRIVHRPDQLESAFSSAAREAQAAFGDDRIFVERAILSARHVEIQVMADGHGHVVHLGERDCSVQRRHQKVIEESPCPSLQMTPEIRNAMGEVATRAAAAVQYRGAGTVEFLFEETPKGPRFYFLEMNTRLQVEHPVTEAVTGRDLVWDQLRVAAGEPLGYGQDDVTWHGHAIECRIYAEDPYRFLPAPGWLSRVEWPTGPNVRVDAGMFGPGEVSSHYDPMIAKVTVWGSNREHAIDRMRQALRETVLLGIQTNLSFHLRVLGEADFRTGQVTTRYVDLHPDLVTRDGDSRDIDSVIAAAAAAAAARAVHRGPPAASGSSTAAPTASWRHSARWRR